MVQVPKSGPMVPSMKVNGERTRPTVRVSSGTQMVMSMKDSGKMTRLTDLASTFM